MTVRQYIGARYVPIFGRKGEESIEWDNTGTYEPLTVVLYQGNSYTSRQYVPAGVEITNQDYWAETGNYDAQVEQYRRDVQSYKEDTQADIQACADDIQACEDDIQALQEDLQEYETATDARIDALEQANPDVKIFAAPIDGSAVLLQCDENNILFDCGKSESGPIVASWLVGKGVSRLDAVVLTHMHFDHVDGFGSIVSLCDGDTDIYMQMAPTNQSGEYQTYVNKLATVTSICNSNNLKQPVTPNNGSTVEYGKCKLTFYNTDTNNRVVYDNAIANDNYANPTVGGLNNYSLITICEMGDFTYIDAGDLEGEGQRLNTEYMRKCDVARNPHHFGNLMGYFKWHMALSPEYWIVTLFDYEQPDVYVSYIYRFALEGFANKILYPYVNEVAIEWNGSLISATGDYVTFVNQPSEARPMMFYASLPAQYYNADPFILYKMTISQFFAATKNGPQKVVNLFSASPFVATSQLYTELKTLFGITSGTVSMQLGGNIMKADLLASDRRNNEIIFYTSYVDADLGTNRHYDVVSTDLGAVDATFTTPLAANDSLYNQGVESYVIDKILHANIVTAHLGTGAVVPCVRVGTSTGTGSGSFRGTMLNASATHLYSVQFNNSGTLTQCLQVNLSNGATTEAQLESLSVMG